MKDKYIIFESKGEPMRDLMGTAVVSAMAKKYPQRKIVVASLNPEIWLHNPKVYRVYNLKNLQYFYDDFVKNKDTIIFKHDPYSHNDFITKKQHLIDVWSHQCNLKRGSAMPELYFTAREKEIAQKFIDARGGKPTFIIQTNGVPESMPYPTSFSGDIHMQNAQDVVLHMQKAGFVVLQLKGPGQESFPGAVSVDLNLRETLCLIGKTDKRLFNDSTAHHAAISFGIESVITWNTLTPELHGYSLNKNVHPIVDTDFTAIQDSFVEEFRLKRFLPKEKPTYTKPLHRTTDILTALEI